MASYKEQYYNLEEEEMQRLIQEAKNGSGKAKEELLKVFNNFLTKYVTMLHVGKYSFSDYDIRRFMSLFVKDTFVRYALLTQDDLFNDGETEDTAKGGAYVDTLEYATVDTPFNNDVNEFWVLGEGVNDLFGKLSLQERQLLKWRYIDGKRSSEIAIKITEHPNTVREHLTKIRDKIEIMLDEPRNGRI